VVVFPRVLVSHGRFRSPGLFYQADVQQIIARPSTDGLIQLLYFYSYRHLEGNITFNPMLLTGCDSTRLRVGLFTTCSGLLRRKAIDRRYQRIPLVASICVNQNAGVRPNLRAYWPSHVALSC
jgi:hypothetical protein